MITYTEDIKSICKIIQELYTGTKDNKEIHTDEIEKYLIVGEGSHELNLVVIGLMHHVKGKEYIKRKDIELWCELVMEDIIVYALLYAPSEKIGNERIDYREVLRGIAKVIQKSSPEVNKLVRELYKCVCELVVENETLHLALQEAIWTLACVPNDMDSEIKIDKRRIIREIERRYRECVE